MRGQWGPVRSREGMLRKTRSRALRRRILLFVVTTLIVMGTVVGVIATRPLATELAEAQRRELDHALDFTALSIGQFAQSARSVALQVTSRTRIREILEEYQAGAVDESSLRAFTEPKLRDAMVLSDTVVGITRLDASGATVAAVGEPVPARYSTPASEVTITDIPELGGTDPRFLVSAPIVSPEDAQVGTDLVVFDAAPLTELLASERLRKDERTAQAIFTGGAVRATATDGFFVPGDSDWRWSFQNDRAVFAQNNWTTKSTAVASTPWSVAISLPNDAVYAPVRQQLLGVALSVALVLLGGIAGAFFLVRPLAGGIVVQTEELESEVESKTAELQDELVRRSAAESNLAESNTRLRDTNAELARTVAEAEAQREAAVQANQAKTAFLGNMSHDLRTPLQGILGFLSLLSETVESTDQVKYVRYAEESAGDLLRHVDELLEISRIESGGIKILEAGFSLRESVHSLLETLRPQALHKSVSLSAHVTSAVPEQIRSDSARIRQVLSNLLGNAIKYTSVGWIYAHLDYKHHSGNRGTLSLSVHDTGPGIPESEMEHIFDRFARLDYTTHTAGGVGLGLTITKSIVTMMGGTISCESTVGEGSVFRVELPVTASQLRRLEDTEEREPYGDTREGFLRLILAEDDRMNQIFLSHLLRRLGHEVTVAGNGQEAVDLLEERHYDAVFMDVQMPVINGLDATRRIRDATDKAYTDIPIVGMTAYADLVEQRRFLEAGMNHCITKPVSEEDLRNAIRELEREPFLTGRRPPRR